MHDALQKKGHDIAILGVNEAGEEVGNPVMVKGRDLPWLQDTPDSKVWTTWDVTWRDVVVLDAEGEVVGVYNVTDQDLGEPQHRQELMRLLVPATEESASE